MDIVTQTIKKMTHIQFTNEELEVLKRIAKGFPRQSTGDEQFIWDAYLKITPNPPKRTQRPGSPTNCKCHGKHWRSPQDTIARYLDELEGNEIV